MDIEIWIERSMLYNKSSYLLKKYCYFEWQYSDLGISKFCDRIEWTNWLWYLQERKKMSCVIRS